MRQPSTDEEVATREPWADIEREPSTDREQLRRLRRKLAAMERDLENCRTGITGQLELAAQVHRSLLPQPVRDPRIHVDVRYTPIEQVGGDYCQVRFPDQDTCFITTCDVTGHGIGPALLATRVSSEVRYSILYGRPPREIVRTLNTFVYDHFEQTGLYLSFVVAEINLPNRRITWCGAGHPSPLLIRRRGSRVEELPSQNPLIGIGPHVLDRQPEHTVQLEPGDRLLFYTDGLTETADAEDRQLGTAGLSKIAAAAMSRDLFEMADHILERVAEHEHGPSTDDKTLIVAEIK